MPFFQIKKINYTGRLFSILLVLTIVTGCVPQKAKTVNTAEQVQPNTEIKPTPARMDREINAVSIEQKDNTIEIRIAGNQKLVYTSIKQAFPFGIAVYLPETRIADGLKINVPDNPSIGDIIAGYADTENSTAKIEILLKQDLSYEVAERDNILKVALLGTSKPSGTDAEQTSMPVVAETKATPPMAEETPVVIPDKTATMTNIEFNVMEDGKSDIVVHTNHPVKYDITRGGNEKLYLNLYNTIIPEYHKRPLLTQYFKSAVESIMPVQAPGKKKLSKIEIKTRDQVPYRIVQDQNVISLYFDPAGVEPPVFAKAKKTVQSGADVETMDTPKQSPTAPDQTLKVSDEKPSLEEEIFGAPKQYTGEKIKLDFYETDIKNVIRILRSVGGMNFAIDKNVEGKVTLTLEDPVPWDQVLDLVLKMNNLGMKKEGNVIRIATLDTIKKEEKALQDVIVARQKTLEQKKDLEPLATEYIPINYSDAEKDIKPHIDQILTKDRGTISVDKRTNMVIITDTQEKIDQAREIIYRLDKVTPQIMIEAKVVEVTKDFSRELGVGLSLTERNTATAGVSDFTVALNSPVSAPATSGSFNFFRLFGSSLTALNAQIAASETKGDVKVVSSPRILTLDNKSAKIKQGLEYAYLERDDTGGSSVKFKNIDLLLEVTPHVTPDKRIAMTVYLTKNDIDSVTNGVPSLSTNEAETELLVNNNDTIIIGGIVKTTDSQSTSGVPILSGIPILGRLFRTDIDKDKRNELLIFLTPSIVQLEQRRNAFTTTD